MITVRPMADDDVAGAEEAWHDAFSTMRAHYHLPVQERTAQTADGTRGRIRHLRETDPAGSWVAFDEDRGEVVGLSQALVRDDLWVLSLLGVSPRCQDRGTGRALLDAALSYRPDTPYGMILCSRDPRAARRYLTAGFSAHPSVTAWGPVDRDRLPPSPSVRPATLDEAGFISDLQRRLRGGAHGPDLARLMEEGCQLLVVPERGYVVARGAKPVFLGADDEAVATELLAAALGRAGSEPVEVNWITAQQQWAMRTAVAAGMELHPVGPVMIRGRPHPPTTYLPSGAFA
ncbi:MAG TPA: GNAT family N-acetyltransferase [Acidimicrobiales bacterium]|nr:GNAT family N-acetyltransferase [Acidimicrobiales bacterium]